MSTTTDSASATAARQSTDERKQSPPAFLDLADSAARLGTNMSDMSARVELKRMEHERQRALQRKMFENHMRALEHQQQAELLAMPYDSGVQQVAVSAPTTPPRVNAGLPLPASSLGKSVDADTLSRAVGSAAEKRKSVRYAPESPELLQAAAPGYGRSLGHKSMPASRRTSASSADEDLADHLQNLSLIGEKQDRASPLPGATPSLSLNGVQYANAFNAGVLLDEQLDQEMNNAMRNLPTPADDKFQFLGKVTPAALDLASQREKAAASEWSAFESGPRGPESLAQRAARRVSTNPPIGGIGEKLNGAGGVAASPLLQQGIGSRRGSPLPMGDPLAQIGASTRSVPGTPLGGLPSSVAAHLMRSGAATPLSSEIPNVNGRLGSQLNDSPVNAHDLQASLTRLGNSSQYDSPLTFNSIRSGLDDFEVNPNFGMNGGLDGGRFSSSPSLYGGSGRFGPGMGSRSHSADKINGLHGAKHKRGEIDREFNRFAGTRIEDLAGEISALCKDQHGCRYLQKKLEEGLPEHRDMIFRETFSQFADLMTDPFGNYLCQKLLEHATDEQRNLICESVAQDLVNISLNMHGTRAVQKMIDFLSTRRQIHSIIVALSLHVVVLIKDLNGNHVIQKCLNKLAPEDNQFIYNAVAANCVEVATHRHGCCVLQRCIDHASDQQRVQLVNEITYNALTLVQDPYGNYVVQYILDLNDNRFSDAVIRQFTGNVCALSVQKFSSNVIEKCIRVAEHSTRKLMIEELLNRSRLEKLLRDSYGNYCVQTALDYADPSQRALLVEGIRPVLPLIRNTPYGKRIQNKLQREQADHFGGGSGYHNHMGGMGSHNMGMSPHGLGNGRHMSPMHQSGSLGDVYGGQNGLHSLGYSSGLGGFQGGAGLHNGLPGHSLEPYLMQGGGQGLSHSPNGFSTMSSFGNGGYGNGGLAAGINASPYQRTAFGYGM